VSVTTHYGHFAAIEALVAAKQGIFLDVGCADHKSKGAVGMDIRPLPGVDIVHSLLDIPWPLPDACCLRILASHIWEHLPPDRINGVMDECWRVMRPDGQLLISMPYANSMRAMQDPTHYRCWNEVCAQYYDPAYPLYQVYRVQPWKVELNQWSSEGDIAIVLAKRTLAEASTCAYGK
jgi:predicted SAM-dependent methyltransferase